MSSVETNVVQRVPASLFLKLLDNVINAVCPVFSLLQLQHRTSLLVLNFVIHLVIICTVPITSADLVIVHTAVCHVVNKAVSVLNNIARCDVNVWSATAFWLVLHNS